MGQPPPSEDPGFAPSDLTDGRPPFEWKSLWPSEARRGMRGEAIYIALVFALGFATTYAIWSRQWDFGLTDVEYRTLAHHAYAFLGGLLGGTLFDLKWLYHSVAKGKWHLDRRYWRLFTPFISAGLAFGVFLLASSGLIPLVDEDELRQSGAMVMGLSFLVGYFSDNTTAAMARLADRLFGEKDSHKARPRA